ncbi:hypothetical protein NIES2119_12820 [[Phormidium ambiguum] IAM M-71]|uniref:DUF3616 domain-containing protein n=1 Tax=[Phormidium ambiguum] IAM M-71 TaxID=454136 RepID=A0A1U7IK97_9CYAN|nr:DUF3616 domain-containing protein [Phormidium ambiguum]OKH37582.1 hypothetical protein NIES2119_12820 [Phormidium ambiguum IAM M-71]
MEQILLRFESEFAKSREDLSAITITPGEVLWLGCDENTSIERLTKTDDKTFAEHEIFHLQDFIDLPKGADEEIDIEGMDYANNYIWLVGSHSLKRPKAKSKRTDLENMQKMAEIKREENRYLLARIPVNGDRLCKTYNPPENPEITLTAAKLENTDNGNLLIDALLKDPHLAPFLKSEIPSKENGFDIEGLAVYEDKIFLGLRGPVLRGWAIILEISVEESSPNTLKLKSLGDKLYKKHFVNLSGLGVRELAVDDKDLLVLAGPTMDLDGPVKLYRIENGVNLSEESLLKPTAILDIPFGEGVDHAEGLAFWRNGESQKSLLVVYDSPAKERLQGKDGILIDVFPL